jgi:hypothetical protein
MTDQTFFSDETGAVTVDWVVLTAALVGLALAMMGVVRNGVQGASNNIDTQLRADGIIRTAFSSADTGLSAADSASYTNTARGLQNAALDAEIAAWTAQAAASQTAVDTFASNNGGLFDADGAFVASSASQSQIDEYTSLSETAARDNGIRQTFVNENTERGR